jgi:hypothetical protein
VAPEDETIYEAAADMMKQSVVVGAVPRDVLLRLLHEHFPDASRLRAEMARAAAIAAELAAAGYTGIGYDAAELERVREQQRRIK